MLGMLNAILHAASACALSLSAAYPMPMAAKSAFQAAWMTLSPYSGHQGFINMCLDKENLYKIARTPVMLLQKMSAKCLQNLTT